MIASVTISDKGEIFKRDIHEDYLHYNDAE